MVTSEKRRVLKRLFVASLVLSLLCAAAWRVSMRRTFALHKSSGSGRIDIRLRGGQIFLTMAETPFLTVGGWLWSVEGPRSAVDQWPELAETNRYWPWRGATAVLPRDPGDDSFLGFVSVSREGLDVLAIPLWSIIVLLGLFQAWWLVKGRLTRARHASGHCIECGYDLRQIQSLCCPECGHRFSFGKVDPVPTSAVTRHKTGETAPSS